MKRKYKIIVEELISEEFLIEADSKEDAVKEAIRKYNASEIVLCPGNVEQKRLCVTESSEENDWIEF